MAIALTHKQLSAAVPGALAELLGVPKSTLETQPKGVSDADLVVSAAGQTFVVEVSGAATAGRIAIHADQALRAAKKLRRRATPLVVVPFMSEAGRSACEGAQASWFDLSGNAHIIAPGIRVIVDGRPDRFRGPGRPASIFAPKSARVARWLLMYPKLAFTQRDLARATDMSEGFISRIASRLERDRYVVREPSGALRVRDPELLLDAWRGEYQFSKHTLIQGHLAARSGDALARLVSHALQTSSVEHAATGLTAAWQLTHFAAFRIATFFLAVEPSEEWKQALGFREDSRGANVWFVVPNDLGVFHGADVRDGIRCVHPVQAYVDLKGHPERAAEAAEHLRAEFTDWKRDA